MAEDKQENPWHSKTIQTLIPWPERPIRPADVGSRLVDVMLSRENHIEDVKFRKVVPNVFVVEVSPQNYTRNYKPIEHSVLQQWQEKLMVRLALANSRLGRKEYLFGGQVQIEIRPVDGLTERQARILSQVRPDKSSAGEPAPGGARGGACLEILNGNRRFPLRLDGATTIGRDRAADISLNWPEVQEKRLVSGQHAYITARSGQFRLFDGAPEGRGSLNGTYVNNQPVPPGGTLLKDGDLVILAAIDRSRPNPHTPGVAAFTFKVECR